MDMSLRKKLWIGLLAVSLILGSITVPGLNSLTYANDLDTGNMPLTPSIIAKIKDQMSPYIEKAIEHKQNSGNSNHLGKP